MIYFKSIAFFNLYILHIIFISFIFTNKNDILKKIKKYLEKTLIFIFFTNRINFINKEAYKEHYLNNFNEF